jgi:hypothetical protein
MAPQLVIEVVRFKILEELWHKSTSRRVVAFIEGQYHNKVVKSADSKVYNGSSFCIPWSEALQKVQVNFFFIDDLLTLDIGAAVYVLAQDKNFTPDGEPIEVVLKLYPNGGTVPNGRLLARVRVQDMFDDEERVVTTKQQVVKNVDHSFAVPGFRFKRLSRVLHWERIRALNLSQ